MKSQNYLHLFQTSRKPARVSFDCIMIFKKHYANIFSKISTLGEHPGFLHLLLIIVFLLVFVWTGYSQFKTNHIYINYWTILNIHIQCCGYSKISFSYANTRYGAKQPLLRYDRLWSHPSTVWCRLPELSLWSANHTKNHLNFLKTSSELYPPSWKHNWESQISIARKFLEFKVTPSLSR